MQYNPRSFFRQVPNFLLARFFSRYSIFFGIPWRLLKEADVEPVLDRWQQMPESDRQPLANLFRQIHDLANAQGTTALIESARGCGLDILTEIRAMKNAHARAFWCMLEHPEILGDARTLAHIDALPLRSWEKWIDLPVRPNSVNDIDVANLEHSIAEYFQNRDGRGERCRVEHRRRPGNIDCFFAYPADYADEIIGYGEDGMFARTQWQGAFEVVYALDGGARTLELYAEGGRQVRQELSELFIRVVLEENHPLHPAARTPYRMDVFKNRHLTFPTDPADTVTVRLKGLRFQVSGNTEGIIAVDAGRHGRSSAYSLLEKAVDQERVPLEKCMVLDATLQAVFQVPANRPRSVTFKVSPWSCTLGDSVEEEKLKRYLKQWQIEHERCA
ncbi:MAG: hypothetical protein HY820_04515 [Acidobacteria bacterium]|nr:hypothetical protein [Acidobacteriota bacterium]